MKRFQFKENGITSDKINLGAGKDVRIDWDNQDVVGLPGINIVFNLDKGNWPIPDNTYDEVCAKMVLEHLSNWTQALEEIWRISKPGAKVYIEVPFFPSYYCWVDPSHKSCFTYYTFDYFEPGHTFEYYSPAKFNIKKKYIRYSWNRFLNFIPAFFINLMPRIYSRYLCFIFPSNSLEVQLEVVKK
jgi:SAM-dependent methyltransferase